MKLRFGRVVAVGMLSAGAVALLVGYRTTHWTACGRCWAVLSGADYGVAAFGAELPLWRTSEVKESVAVRRRFVAPHEHVPSRGFGGARVSGGLLAGGSVICGDVLPSEFAREITTCDGLAEAVDARLADGTLDRATVASLIEVPGFRERRCTEWERDETRRALLRAGAEIVAAFRGVPVRDVHLWRGADPFEPVPPPRPPGGG